MTLRIRVHDRDRNLIREIDDFQSLTVTEKHTGGGSWSLDLDSSVASVFEPGTRVVIDSDGQRYSGPVASLKRDKTDDADRMQVSGPDDTVWLRRRLALPCAPNFATAPHVYTAAGYDQRSGASETVIKGYVGAALSAAAGTGRALPGLAIVPDSERGTDVTMQARFDVLAELIASTALAGGDLGYYLKQGAGDYDKRAMVFDVVEPIDRTATARFATRLGNLAAFSYERSAPEANYILVAAQGELTDRLTVEGGDAASLAEWGRIEGPLRDRRDTADLVQMTQTRDEELAKGAQKLALSVSVSDTERLAFGKDWGLHDRVSVEIDGVTFTELVRETTLHWSNDAARSVTAVIGTPEATAPNVLKLFAAQRTGAARIARLERIP